MKTLLTFGILGSVVRVILNPDKQWKRWLLQVFVGVAAAVSLGQVVGHLVIAVIGVTGSMGAYSAAGFIIGTAAEKAIEAVQNKFFPKPDKHDE